MFFDGAHVAYMLMLADAQTYQRVMTFECLIFPVEIYHRGNYENFYKIIDTMLETFFSTGTSEEHTAATLHFNAYFIAKVRREGFLCAARLQLSLVSFRYVFPCFFLASCNAQKSHPEILFSFQKSILQLSGSHPRSVLRLGRMKIIILLSFAVFLTRVFFLFLGVNAGPLRSVG